MKARKKRAVGASPDSPAARKPKSPRQRKPAPGKTPPAAPVPKRRRPVVPPPDSDIWPEQYRGANWKPAYAFLFAGKCQLCTHSCPLPRSRQLRDKWRGENRLLQCTDHPNYPGEIVEVLPTDTCRNFKQKWWRRAQAKAKKDLPAPVVCRAEPGARRIPLGNGLFALVDAADYPRISQYKWYASRKGKSIYAITHQGGLEVAMHRMIMKPRRGYIVHHRDHNGLNNRRDNLLVCTPRQHQAARGPCGGRSGYVGVYPHGNILEARIRHRGKSYVLGYFRDPVEAAKARDRKAYELHGKFAYLNFPEDYDL